MLAIWFSICVAGAWAQEGPDGDGDAEAPSTIDTREAARLGTISQEQYKELAPKRHLQPQDPYNHVDFTAYSLDWGEVRVGAASITVGVLPRTQFGTVPALDALGVPNGSLKVDAIQAGPVHIAGTGAYYRTQLGEFVAQYTQGGVLASVEVLPPWSVHISGTTNWVAGDGFPDLTELSPVLSQYSRAQLDDWTTAAQARNVDLELRAMAVTAKLATDVRLNRRDSLIFQVQSALSSRVSGGVGATEDVPPIAGMDQMIKAGVQVTAEEGGRLPLGSNYLTTLSYQASFKNWEFRAGGGWSYPIPYTWVLQAIDVGYRFGGSERERDTRVRKGYRRNKRQVAPQ